MTDAVRAPWTVLRIVRRIDAPRETVFRAWTQVELFRQWFGPVVGSTPSTEFDAREGGAFRVAMKVPGMPVVFATGTFREIKQPERLVFDFGWERVPGDPADTRVTVEFHDRGSTTELVLTQERFPRRWERAFHLFGWSACFRRLRRLV
jgi:uncharacterized protein YndB with AHSA1/START domain